METQLSLSVEDRVAIQELLSRFAYAIDFGDEKDLLAVLTDNPVFESAVRGKMVGVEAIRASVAENQDLLKPYRLRHFISNVIIDGDRDKANVLAYFLAYSTARKPKPYEPHPNSELKFVGHYDCTVRKTDGGWRIERRVAHIDNRDK
jgi:SnoaL-like domain